MANELVPQPRRRPDGHGNGHHASYDGKVFDPLVAAGFVDTDAETAGMEWDYPPTGDPRESFEAARVARHHARLAEEDAHRAHRRGDTGFAVLRAADAGDNRQAAWDWGDLRTWAVIWAMFFGFLLLVAFVYFLPYGRHNQDDGPTPVPNIRVY
ncbi:MAG: hypothetical protein JO250_03210 [Armatimonadetes bacterium]|nr:hypothetical protein [Armatimonadota bacterium]